jgi:hypothetical protein
MRTGFGDEFRRKKTLRRPELEREDNFQIGLQEKG